MTVKQRIIWTTDEEWQDIGEMAKASGMTRSRLIVETVQVLIPDRPQVPPTTPSDVPRITPDRRRVDVDSGQSRRREDQEKIQALSGPPSLAETRRMRAAASRAFGQFRPAPKPGKR